MAQWQIINADGTAVNFTDKQTALPGEPEFSIAEVKKKAGTKAFNYLGQSPDYIPPVIEEPAEETAQPEGE